MPASRPIEERFREKVATDRTPRGCLLWTGGTVTDSGGMVYGVVKYKGKSRRAHVVSFILATGIEPGPGQCVCHSCDVPLCVERTHLWLGSRADNNADMVAKGRLVRRPFESGLHNPQAKVTPEMVEEIIELRAQGWTYREIAVKLNLSAATVCRNFNKQRSEAL